MENDLNVLNLLIGLGGLVLGAVALGIGSVALLALLGVVLGFLARDVLDVRLRR